MAAGASGQARLSLSLIHYPVTGVVRNFVYFYIIFVYSKSKMSAVWNFFSKVNNNNSQNAACYLCGKEYKTCGNTTNLAAHLKTKHLQCFFKTFTKKYLENKCIQK